MAALDYLHRAGLTVEAVADKLRASPVERITLELRQYIGAHKVELLAELSAANEITAAPANWLHLLALADGRVIQRCGERSTANIEEEARLHCGDDLLAVVAVPGVERPLTEVEIDEAQAGTLATPAARPPPSSTWLARVARRLGARPAVLLEGGHLEQHDLAELAGTDAAMVADTIRASPAWISRPRRIEQPVERLIVEEKIEPLRTVHTAATASQAWREADAAYTNHLMSCRDCHAPTGRYCATGADLHSTYERTPLESAP
ncbi:hypothetical protein PS647_03764 [Pseudomonas fluorescens]|uniref:hypothetical protein n=1 Tax=Pseudomonas fluorescens TaxID=294 RepID=UPI0012531CC5|nr:hypothetical protein [Pseudomonas fluorescens]VVN09430.1 hypothetical protein PS647_03764 [Pseudomonas fluorescens]